MALGGVVIVSLVLARERWLACGAVLLSALLGYGLVYVGAYYPGDCLAGAGFGIVIGLLTSPGLSFANESGRRGETQARHRPAGVPITGPATEQSAISASGSVRLLSEREIRPRTHASDGAAARPVSSS
jgi:hypothetical protein